MDKYIITGGKPLNGTVDISGAKNSAVAIIPATILSDDVCVLENVPDISDVVDFLEILEYIGAKVVKNGSTVSIDPRTIDKYEVPKELAGRMRASYYLIGALLGKKKKAVVGLPGGCDIGDRGIDQHVKGFELLGANVVETYEKVDASARNLLGAYIYLDVVSVGATINVMLAATKAPGTTIIENAAREPHIVDVANFLISMGANIRGAGTDTIKINGVKQLSGSNWSIIPDQIEAGTYMVAAAATGGEITVNNVTPQHLASIIAKLIDSGADVEEFDESVKVSRKGLLKSCIIRTRPHPGFPTDMQPQMAALLSVASGNSMIKDGVWPDRFRYVEQLNKMGAKIEVDGNEAEIAGVSSLKGAKVIANDLRAGAAMLIAALIADGETEIGNIHYIERGYQNVVEKLTALGADIKRVSIPD